MRGQNHLEKNITMKNGSSTNYNLTLINHMLPLSAEDLLDKNRKLKNETRFDDDPCAVSSHADSSLENYSTIAVYQALEKGNDYENLTKRIEERLGVVEKVEHKPEYYQVAELEETIEEFTHDSEGC